MSNVHSFVIQNALLDDFMAIRRLMKKKKTQFLGASKRTLIEPKLFYDVYSTHCIVARVKAGDEEVIGFADFKHFPKILPLNVGGWIDWLHHHFCIQLPLSMSNTLYLTSFIYHTDYLPELFLTVLREVFFRESKLRYIITMERPRLPMKYKEDIPSYELFRGIGRVFYPKIFSLGQCSNTQRVYIIHRDDVIIKMRYRRALPEDNDDIVDVIDIDLPCLKKDFGDFYIAEELLANKPHKTMIITEVNHVTVGFFWLNSDVDIQKLIGNFELESYGNLIKFSPTERSKKTMVHVTEIERKDMSLLFTKKAIDDLFDDNVSLSLEVDKESWSSYASIETCNEPKPPNISDLNFVNFCWLQDCFQRLQKINLTLKSTKYYFKTISRLMRVYHNVGGLSMSNVFAMQLVGLHTSCDFREMFRFLIASFSSFSDRDYCIFAMPVQWQMTPTLKELLRYFIPVLPRPGNTIEDALYITHRSCLYGDISVHNLKREDTKTIREMFIGDTNIFQPFSSEASVQTEGRAEDSRDSFQKHEAKIVNDIMDNVLDDPSSDYRFLTIRVGNSALPLNKNVIIGYVILRLFPQLHLVKQHFQIFPTGVLLHFVRGEIITLKLHPLFRFESDFIFREIARTAGYWEFYYIQPTCTKMKAFSNDLVIKMQPVEPKRIKKYCQSQEHIAFHDRTSIANLVSLNIASEKYALYYHNMKRTQVFGSHRSVVIIGYNSISKSFMRLKIFEWNSLNSKNPERFCCAPQLNITVIGKPGFLEADMEVEFECPYCVEQDLCWLSWSNHDEFVKDAIYRIDLAKYIKFVNGRISKINREEHFVVMENNCRIFYHDLILNCETDYGNPKNISDRVELPPNYHHFNTRFDKLLFYHKMRVMVNDCCDEDSVNILVYGQHCHVFEFINFLINHGIKSKHIILVLNVGKPAEVDALLNNPAHDPRIEIILQEMVEDLGVKVYEQCNFVDWIMHENTNNIKSVVFEMSDQDFQNQLITIDCEMFVSFFEVNMDLRLFRKSGITMKNGNIVVDYAFRTSDPGIYAVGKCTEFDYESDEQYKYVNPREIAEKLIESMSKQPTDEDQLDLVYHHPSYCGTQLPFGYYMTKVVLPKKCLTRQLSSDYSLNLVTYHNYEFCRVRLNPSQIVEEIVIITQKVLSMDFIKFFIGKHESLLNNLYSRWYLRCFQSFLDFFQEPWTELIQHDRFYELSERTREMALSKAEEIMDMPTHLTRKDRKLLLEDTLRQNGVTAAVEANFLSFLRKYRSDFQSNFVLPEDFPV